MTIAEFQDTAPRRPVVHDLKLWSRYMDAVATGQMTAEIRFNDRDYRVGDYLFMHEYDPDVGEYVPHRNVMARITDVKVGDETFGLDERYVHLSFELLSGENGIGNGENVYAHRWTAVGT